MQDERRFDVRTLIIASIASAAAAVITSQFWIRGTPIAAALTPIIVTLVSELLHRPTAKIAQRRTTGADESPRELEDESLREFKVYRSGAARRRRIAWATVLTTGLLAFVIAAVVLTVPELIAGGSIGGRDRATTLVPSKKKDRGDRDGQAEQTVTEEQQTVTETVPSEPETVTETTPAEPRTTPTTPEPQATPPPATTPTTPTTPAP